MILLVSLAFSQTHEIKPVTVGEAMPNITLPTYQGGDLSLASLKGKNVMIIFPRGYAAEGRWCTICNYKYAELIDLEKNAQLRKKYDLEILYVFSYGKDIVKKWLDDLPGQLEKIKDWKYPAEQEKLDEKGILQFKYIGQNTWDRPSYDYLLKILEMIDKNE